MNAATLVRLETTLSAAEEILEEEYLLENSALGKIRSNLHDLLREVASQRIRAESVTEQSVAWRVSAA
jgi:hypothetical protein